MATKEKLDSIAASKAAIKAAIQEKGVSCDDTLAEYANRIKAIPTGSSIKVEELRTITLIENSSFSVIPSTGFDAMKSVKIDVKVPQEVGKIEIEQNIDELVVGTTINFTVIPVSGLNLLSLFGQIGDATGLDRRDYGLDAIFIDHTGISAAYIIITETSQTGATKNWLAETGVDDETFTNVTLTVLQEITITQ